MVLCDELEARQQQERAGCLKLGTASLVALQNAESPEEFEQLWAQVCDAFELILDCPENVEVLRQTILQLAVQGQLNTNDPSDNPIHIQLKIPINCLKICELHNPFHDNWIVTSIANISKKVVDGVHKTPTYRSRGIPFLTVKNLTKGKNIDYSDVKYISREEHLELIQRTKPEKNDILITKDGTIGVTRKIREDIEFSIFVTLALVKPIDPDISDYLEIALSSPQIQNNMLRTGSGLKHLVLRDINRLLIPIPPLAEQRRIVAKVNKLIEVCDLLERHLKGYEEMQGRFANAIISKIAGKVN
jgi:type I restriction enzyme S subunit